MNRQRPTEGLLGGLWGLPAVEASGPDGPALRQLGLEPDLAAAVEAQTDAMPLFVVELIREWVRSGLIVGSDRGYRLRDGAQVPEDLHSVWLRRIGRALRGLDRSEHRATELAGVLGLRFSRAQWSEAAQGAGWWASARLLGRLQEAGLLETDRTGQQLAWVHALLRDSLIRHARQSGRLKGCHEACLPVSEGVELGQHLLALDRHEEALEPLLEGAWKLVVDSEYLRAERALTMREVAVGRLGLKDRRAVEGWVMQARVARRRQRHDRARTWAYKAARGAQWPDLRCQALRELVRVHQRKGEVDKALAAAQEAVLAAGKAQDRLALAWARRDLGLMTGEVEVLAEALRVFEDEDEVFGAATVALKLGRLELAEQRFRQALERQEPAWSWVGLGDVAARQGDSVTAEAHYLRAVRRFEEIGGPGLDEARHRVVALR